MKHSSTKCSEFVQYIAENAIREAMSTDEITAAELFLAMRGERIKKTQPKTAEEKTREKVRGR
jgi:hypothetical protein